jgi:hypothetical protein
LIETIRASVIGDHEEMELPAAEQGIRVLDGHLGGLGGGCGRRARPSLNRRR